MRRRHRLLVAAGLLGPSCAAPTGHRGHAQRSPVVSTVAESTDAAGPSDVEEPVTSVAGPASTTTTVTGLPPAADGTTTTTVRPRPLPTTTLPERRDEHLTDEEWWAQQPGHQASTRESLLACIRHFEQGEDGYSTDTGNGFYGAYQFTLGTWASVGGSGNPAHASPAEQDGRAWALYLSRGLAPWPTPARHCG